MSDIDGTQAFDNVLDRLLDKAEQAAAYNRQRDEYRSQAEASRQEIRDLARKLETANIEITRLKTLVTPEALAADEARRRADPNDIPF